MILPILSLIFDYLDDPLELIQANVHYYKQGKKCYLSAMLKLHKTEFEFNDLLCGKYKWKYIKIMEGCCPDLTYREFRAMPHLHTLIITRQSDIGDRELKYLPNLITLALTYNGGCQMNISDKGLKNIPNIENLILCNGRMGVFRVTDDGLQYMPKLKILVLEYPNSSYPAHEYYISAVGLRKLPRLEVLGITSNILDINCIMAVQNLKELYTLSDVTLDKSCLKYLPKIERFCSPMNDNLEFADFKNNKNIVQIVTKKCIYNGTFIGAQHTTQKSRVDKICDLNHIWKILT